MIRLKIGTRCSQLALWQAHAAGALLESNGAQVEYLVISTGGDRLQRAPLSEAGGKRLFVKEIDDALLSGDVDVAVHSAKDMPAVLADGLDIAATLPREDPRDVIVLPPGARARGMTAAAQFLGGAPTIATGSVRRVAQLSQVFPGAQFMPIRGNVDTRLRKLDNGEVHALILAAAGIRRLGQAHRISAEIPVSDCVPAPGQGIVALEIRADDHRIRQIVEAVSDADARAALDAERALVAALGGGCQVPLGAVALQEGTDLDLLGVVISPDGARAARHRARGPASDAAGLGQRAAEALVRAGAGRILEELR